MPGGHKVPVEPPELGQYVPGGQVRHVAGEVAPIASEYVPGPQSFAAVNPSSSQYVPMGQGTGFAVPDEQ